MVNEIRLEDRRNVRERERERRNDTLSRFSTGGEGVEPGRSGVHSKNQVEDVSKTIFVYLFSPFFFLF